MLPISEPTNQHPFDAIRTQPRHTTNKLSTVLNKNSYYHKRNTPRRSTLADLMRGMFASHAVLALRYTGPSMSRGKATQILRLTLTPTRQATREIRPPTQLYRFQSSSSTVGGGAMTNNNNNSMKVKFAAGTDETALTTALQELLDSAGKGGRWTLISSGQGLERSFKFKNFTKTWDFMTAVALQCKLKNHHPEWSNVYNTTYIRWTTHSPAGLSAKDVELAGLCDALARDFGEVVDSGDAAQSCGLRQVADRVVVDAGDCCTPKKK